MNWLRITMVGSVLACCLATGQAIAQDNENSPTKEDREEQAQPSESPSGTDADAEEKPAAAGMSRHEALLAGLTIFVLAVFVGFEVITKVPPTLHTPLMSGSNAISGITLVGAVIVAGKVFSFSTFLGVIAVVLASVNAVGGFLVTHRMLAMFKKR